MNTVKDELVRRAEARTHAESKVVYIAQAAHEAERTHALAYSHQPALPKWEEAQAWVHVRAVDSVRRILSGAGPSENATSRENLFYEVALAMATACNVEVQRR